MSGIRDARRRYEKWWLGKHCRLWQGQPFRRVVHIELIGPPSFFYGDVWLTFEDGERLAVQTDAQKAMWKPEKILRPEHGATQPLIVGRESRPASETQWAIHVRRWPGA